MLLIAFSVTNFPVLDAAAGLQLIIKAGCLNKKEADHSMKMLHSELYHLVSSAGEIKQKTSLFKNQSKF